MSRSLHGRRCKRSSIVQRNHHDILDLEVRTLGEKVAQAVGLEDELGFDNAVIGKCHEFDAHVRVLPRG